MSDPNTCTRCRERYPSPYYFVQGVASLICLRCMKALAPLEQVAVLTQAAADAGEAVRRCLRCDAPMMRGDLIYRDLGSGETTQVREVRWGLARRRLRFLGLVSEWVIEKALPLDAWRCGACGYCELTTTPDPGPERLQTPRENADDGSTLL